MGMDNAMEAFWHQMSAAGKMDEDIFTLCFARQPTAEREGTESGAMTLGGVDDRLHTSPVVYVSVGVSNAFYGVHVRNVYLRAGGGGDSALSSKADIVISRVDISEADLNRGTTIVDSGTTDTYFTRNIATAFHALWKEMTGKTYNNDAIELTEKELNELPTIIFQLQGLTELNEKLANESKDGPIVGLAGDLDPDHPYDVLLAMPPSHYMEYDNDIKKYVPRFYTDEGRGSVLGANVMMGHNIVFDQVNGRLGIAESHCDYSSLVTGLGFEWNPHEDYHPDSSSTAAEEEETAKEQHGDPANTDDDEDEDKKLAEMSEQSSSEGMGSSHEESAGGFCSGMGCKGGVIAAVVAVVVAIVLRSRSKVNLGMQAVPYDMELELQEGHDDDDGEFGKYRDDRSHEDDDEFHDQVLD
jgi:Eukaryotic aspartyl protease